MLDLLDCNFLNFFLDQVVKLFIGGTVINGATLSSFNKERQKPDTFAVINNYNFYDRHTYIRTWQLYDQPALWKNLSLS